jgi:glycine betaine/proline transport system substrate-binding protein
LPDFPTGVRISVVAQKLLLPLLGAAASLLLSPLAAAACGSKPAIVLAGLNWASGEFVTAVTQELLERGFGCKTETIPGNTVTFEQALANDDLQIIAEEWTERSWVWHRSEQAGKVQGVGHTFTGATEGWAVPDYVVSGDAAHGVVGSAPELRSVAQLTDPRYVRLFRDPEQPTRGRFLNCPSGWTCEAENGRKLRAYGLSSLYVDFRPGTGPAMDAAIISAYVQHQPLLFYYWSPSAIAGRLKFRALEEPPYTPDCWDRMVGTPPHPQGCASPPSNIVYGFSRAFASAAPEIVAFIARATFPLAELNANLAKMAQEQRSARAQAIEFLNSQPQIWQPWVGEEMAARVRASLQGHGAGGAAQSEQEKPLFPARFVISLRKPVNDAVASVVSAHGAAFRSASHAVLALIITIDDFLTLIPWWLLIAIFMGLAWLGTHRPVLTVVIGVLMFVVGSLGLWALMLQTLTLMLVSSALALLVGLPLGILTAKSAVARAVVLPVLDIMQTMPSFVYLIPALMLFGLGKVPAILATVIYALPPMIRLTSLGIEQVDPEIKEAATAFGCTPAQMLLNVELPLARSSILAGVNQTIMLALSMVVVASMIGARGLGEQVLNGIQTLDVGQGLEAGIGIVILAVVLDRVTQGFGRRGPGAAGAGSGVRRG